MTLGVGEVGEPGRGWPLLRSGTRSALGEEIRYGLTGSRLWRDRPLVATGLELDMARAEGVTARERARQARIALTQKRAERYRKIERAATAFFTADEAAAKARQAMEKAEVDKALAVQSLGELDVSTSDIADMLGLDVKEVRFLARVKADAGEQDELPVSEAAGSADVSAA